MTFYILLSNTLVIHSCACDLQGLRGEMSFSLSFVTIGVDVPLAIVATIAFASSSSLSLSSFSSSISLFLLSILPFSPFLLLLLPFPPLFYPFLFLLLLHTFPVSLNDSALCLFIPSYVFVFCSFLCGISDIFVIHHFSGKCEISDVTLWGGLCGSV